MSKGRKIPEILTNEEQERLLGVYDTRYSTQLRNKCLVKLMLDSGLRLAETIHLRWVHINLTSGKLKVVQGKGSKDRIIWLNIEALSLLEEWRETIEQIKADRGYNIDNVFITLTGNKMSGANVRKMVYHYTKKAGIDKKISPHNLRHTFATDLLRETNNLRLVQKTLGHSDISTTQIYTHIVDSEMEEALKNFRNGKN